MVWLRSSCLDCCVALWIAGLFAAPCVLQLLAAVLSEGGLLVVCVWPGCALCAAVLGDLVAVVFLCVS